MTTHRIKGEAMPLGEGDDWLHQLARNSVPFGSSPAPGEQVEHHQPPPEPKPVRIPGGPMGDLPPEPPDGWLRVLLRDGAVQVAVGDVEPSDDGQRRERWRRWLGRP